MRKASKPNGLPAIPRSIAFATPQTMRPAMFAHMYQYYVATCTPRNNASIFDPLGYEAAQVEESEAVLVGEIDLSYAILHWSETLHSGKKFVDAYGAENVGFRYRVREDNGIFWSNDPKRTIGDMMRGIKLDTRDFCAERAKQVQDKVRK